MSEFTQIALVVTLLLSAAFNLRENATEHALSEHVEVLETVGAKLAAENAQLRTLNAVLQDSDDKLLARCRVLQRDDLKLQAAAMQMMKAWEEERGIRKCPQ